MKMSFDDEQSFKEATESICFNNSESSNDLNKLERMDSMESSGSMSTHWQERNDSEDT